ncbi:MAG TPA: thioredoxin family protein [Candidatus Babeliales bacterium]|nr:thioredoxin family protein [Candidatus Babeliales bacterium]
MKKILLLAILALPIYLNSAVKVGNIDQFNSYINQERVTVVKFYADWCSPCKQLNPFYTGLENKYGSNANFLTVNIEKATNIKNKYNASRIPFIMVFKSGKVIGRMLGLKNINSQLESLIKQHSQA